MSYTDIRLAIGQYVEGIGSEVSRKREKSNAVRPKYLRARWKCEPAARRRRSTASDEVKVKGKGHPVTGHERPVEVWLYSFFNLGVIFVWGWVDNATPRPLYLRERPGTYSIEGWVGPRTGLDEYG
jgi:hypothetical protein